MKMRIFLTLCILASFIFSNAQNIVLDGAPTSKRKNVQVALDKLNRYITTTDQYEATELTPLLDQAITACKSKKDFNNIVSFYFQCLNTHNPDLDPALVHIYDTYPHTWIPSGSEARYKRKIENLRKILPGAHIPELISHDIDGNAHSTKEIKTHYTVLWFWDPDCDHCQEMTPVLHQYYSDNAERWDMEVFAVEVNEDHDRWVAFSDAHNLWDWTNLSTSMGQANLDFIEFFDIMTTPVIFLIDNTQEYAIIARQLSLDELYDFFENK